MFYNAGTQLLNSRVLFRPQALWFDEGVLLQDTRSASLYDEEWNDYESGIKSEMEELKTLTTATLKLLADVRDATSAQVDLTSLLATRKQWHRGIQEWGDAVRVTGSM